VKKVRQVRGEIHVPAAHSFLLLRAQPAGKHPGTGCAASVVRHCSKGIGDAAPTSRKVSLYGTIPCLPVCDDLRIRLFGTGADRRRIDDAFRIQRAENTSGERVENFARCGISDAVVETASAETLALNCARIVGDIADLAESVHFHHNCFLVVLVIRLLRELDLHARLHKLVPKVVIDTGQREINRCHMLIPPSSFFLNFNNMTVRRIRDFSVPARRIWNPVCGAPPYVSG